MATFTKEEMMEYYRDKWYIHSDEQEYIIDVDIKYNIESDIVSFKNDPCIYWLHELICTMDLENLFRMR
jgi:hypothetical protein